MADGWCPFANPRPVEKYWPGNKGRLAVVDHIAEGSYTGTIGWFTGASETSSHFLIGPNGELTQFVSIHNSAWANGLGYSRGNYVDPQGRVVSPGWPLLRRGQAGFGINPNWTTISIERAGYHTTPWSDTARATHAKLLAWIGSNYPKLLPYHTPYSLIGHFHISPVQKAKCPGPTTDLTKLAEEANAAAREQSILPVDTSYTANSLILGVGQATPRQAVQYIIDRKEGTGEYSNYDVALIVDAYVAVCKRGGVDWVLALAQCLYETGNLTGWWCQRPRRNPAGIGVTGEPGKGVAFPTWVDDAIPAHIGRLLAFRFRDDKQTITAAQQGLIAEALHWRPLSKELRGIAVTWADLNGKWNADKTEYSNNIARIATAICKTRR